MPLLASETGWHELVEGPPAEEAAHSDDAPSRSTHPTEAHELPFEAWQFRRLAGAHYIALMFLLAWDVALYTKDGASKTTDTIALTGATITIITVACRMAVHVWIEPVAAQRLVAWLALGMCTAQYILFFPSYLAMSKSETEIGVPIPYEFIAVPCFTFALITLAFTRVQALVVLLPWAIIDLASLHEASEHWGTPVLPSVGSNVEVALLVGLVFAGSAALFVWVDASARAHHLQQRGAHFREQALLDREAGREAALPKPCGMSALSVVPVEQDAAHTDDAPSRSKHPSEAHELPFEAWQFRRSARAHCVALTFLLAWDVALYAQYTMDAALTTNATFALTDAAATLILLACRTAVHVWVDLVAAQRLMAWLVLGMWTVQYIFFVPSTLAMSNPELASSLTYDLIGVPCWTFALVTLALTRVQAFVLLLPWAILALASVYQASEHWSTPVLPSVGSNVELGLLLSLVYVGSAALFVWVDALARAQYLQLRELAHFREQALDREPGRDPRRSHELDDLEGPPVEQDAAHAGVAPSRSKHPSEAHELPFEAWQFRRLTMAHYVALMLSLSCDVALYTMKEASTTNGTYALTDAAITLLMLACRTAVHAWVEPVAAQRLIVWLLLGTWTVESIFFAPSTLALSKSELGSRLPYEVIGVPWSTFVLTTLAFTRVQALVVLLPWAVLCFVSVYQASEHWSTPVLPSVGSNLELGLLLSLVYVGSAAVFVWGDASARAHHLHLREAHFQRAEAKEREQELLEAQRLNKQLKDARCASPADAVTNAAWAASSGMPAAAFAAPRLRAPSAAEQQAAAPPQTSSAMHERPWHPLALPSLPALNHWPTIRRHPDAAHELPFEAWQFRRALPVQGFVLSLALALDVAYVTLSQTRDLRSYLLVEGSVYVACAACRYVVHVWLDPRLAQRLFAWLAMGAMVMTQLMWTLPGRRSFGRPALLSLLVSDLSWLPIFFFVCTTFAFTRAQALFLLLTTAITDLLLAYEATERWSVPAFGIGNSQLGILFVCDYAGSLALFWWVDAWNRRLYLDLLSTHVDAVAREEATQRVVEEQQRELLEQHAHKEATQRVVEDQQRVVLEQQRELLDAQRLNHELESSRRESLARAVMDSVSHCSITASPATVPTPTVAASGRSEPWDPSAVEPPPQQAAMSAASKTSSSPSQCSCSEPPPRLHLW